MRRLSCLPLLLENSNCINLHCRLIEDMLRDPLLLRPANLNISRTLSPLDFFSGSAHIVVVFFLAKGFQPQMVY